jgi:hypothetical protein
MFFKHLRELCRETKGFESLDLCIARAGTRGGWEAGILGSWEAAFPGHPTRIPEFQDSPLSAPLKGPLQPGIHPHLVLGRFWAHVQRRKLSCSASPSANALALGFYCFQ